VGLLKIFSGRGRGQIILNEVSRFGWYWAHLSFCSCYSHGVFLGSVAWMSMFCSLRARKEERSPVMAVEGFPNKGALYSFFLKS